MERREHKGTRWTLALGVAGLILLLGSAASMAKEPETVTLTGKVMRAEVNSSGKVLRVFIDDAEQGQFLVVRRGKGKELLERVRALVQVTGYVGKTRDPGFSQTIDVVDYTIVEAVPAAQR